jgi:hypothetical protein
MRNAGSISLKLKFLPSLTNVTPRKQRFSNSALLRDRMPRRFHCSIPLFAGQEVISGFRGLSMMTGPRCLAPLFWKTEAYCHISILRCYYPGCCNLTRQNPGEKPCQMVPSGGAFRRCVILYVLSLALDPRFRRHVCQPASSAPISPGRQRPRRVISEAFGEAAQAGRHQCLSQNTNPGGAMPAAPERSWVIRVGAK